MTQNRKVKDFSPCTKVCKPNWKGYCIGRFRHILEITHWGTMSDLERSRIMAELPKRKKVCQ
ncbi:MAG: DUF1289 domain-containing protein [Desulfobacterales bacterium]|nr:DUF1289 domain-containing protein [Desulfobacterales bacterium]